MKDRLQIIMGQKNMSLSQFADSIGVQRSTLHHIINGRNNPSLDVIMRICNTYPDIDLEWLIKGESKTDADNPGGAVQTELFPPENQIFRPVIEDKPENQNLKRLEEPGIKVQPLSESTSYDRKITKIIVIYSDGTTDSFEKAN